MSQADNVQAGNGNNALALVPQSGVALAETATAAQSSSAVAIVQARTIMAYQNPRDLDEVRLKLLRECRRPGFADVAKYKKPVGKSVEGPSIRFAEAAIAAMGNMQVTTETLFDNPDKRIVRVTVLDLESNMSYARDIMYAKTIERSSPKQGQVVLGERLNSKGYKVYILKATDDEVIDKEAALVSKQIRTCGLRAVPGWLVEECMDEVEKTKRNRDAQDPDAAKRKLLDSFAKFNVGPSRIVEYLGHPLEEIEPAELSELRSVYQTLADEETTWDEIMQSKIGDRPKSADSEPDTKAQAVRDKMRASRKKAASKKQSEEPEAGDPVPITSEQQNEIEAEIESRAHSLGNLPGGDVTAAEKAIGKMIEEFGLPIPAAKFDEAKGRIQNFKMPASE